MMEQHALVSSVSIGNTGRANSDVLSLLQEAPESNQGLAIEDNVRVGHADVFAGSGGYPPVDAASITDILSGLQVVNFWVRLQEFLGTVVGIVVNNREGKGKGHLQAVEEVGQALNVLQGVVADRHKCHVNGQGRTPLLTNQGPAAPR